MTVYAITDTKKGEQGLRLLITMNRRCATCYSVVKTFAQNKDDRKRVKQAIESAHLLTSSVSRLVTLALRRRI